MRILMVSARYLPFMGGTEAHIREVGTRLVSLGHQVTVLTGNPGGKLPRQEMADGLDIRRVDAYPARRDWCFAPRALGEITRGEWDVIHIQGYHTFMAPLAMVAALWARIPYVITFHSGGHSSTLRKKLRAAQHRILAPLVSRAARLIGVSQFEASLFSGSMRIARNRFTVVPNGARLPKPSPGARRLDDHSPLVVSLGRLERYKGHHRVLDAFKVLLEKMPAAKLRILGEGPFAADLERQVDALALRDHVTIGSIPQGQREAMADLLTSSSLVVLLSDYEAHPVAVMEALSMNVPVLTSDTSGFRELADRNLIRSLPINSSPNAVALAMVEEIKAGTRQASAKLPDWDECAARLQAIYREVHDHHEPRLPPGRPATFEPS